jgi:hypothetical protein
MTDLAGAIKDKQPPRSKAEFSMFEVVLSSVQAKEDITPPAATPRYVRPRKRDA